MKKIIENTFKNAKIELNTENINKFSLFFDILINENKKINLTRITEKEDVAKKHFLDSVFAEKFIKEGSRVIDIGAGAGFPSIPLKIVRPDLHFSLVDSVNKKVDFLSMLTEKLQLENIELIHSRCEDLAQKDNYRERFDTCVARAVAELRVLLEYCLPFVKVGGLFIAYKSENVGEELEKSKRALSVLGGRIKKVFSYKIDEERKNVLVIIEKVRRTPNIYPRRGNKPRISPLN